MTDFGRMTLSDVTKLVESLHGLTTSELDELSKEALSSDSDIAYLIWDAIPEEKQRRQRLEEKRLDREDLRKRKREANGGTWACK